MEQFFTTLLGMSATASWAILAILLLRFFLRKASCQFLRALWAIPALRLLLPFSMQSNASAFQVLPGADAVFGILFQPPSSLSQSSAASSSVGGAPSPIFIASILYLFGACLLLLYGLISFLRLKSRVSSATLLRENIYQSEAVSSPFLLGLFHPRIYLPYHMAPGQMEDVLAHEQEHIAAHDHIWKPFAFLLLCAYWFSPAVWAAYLLFCRDIEFACDERVIRRLIPAQRKKYAQTLLDLAAREKSPPSAPLPLAGETSKAVSARRCSIGNRHGGACLGPFCSAPFWPSLFLQTPPSAARANTPKSPSCFRGNSRFIGHPIAPARSAASAKQMALPIPLGRALF